MKSLDEVLAELHGVERTEVLAWLEAAWVRPERQGDQPRFAAIDIARLRLIRELRHDLALDAEALPVVLSLLDEVYGLRRQLRVLSRALAELPAETRASMLVRCRSLLAEGPGRQWAARGEPGGGRGRGGPYDDRGGLR